jgi:pimeloyl-ACP methyl ester carboxylesterase
MRDRLLLWLAVVVLCPGCTRCYNKLASETQIPQFANLVARRAAMPQRTIFAPTRRPGEPLVRVAICQTGNASADGPILIFVHGAFSDADTWRYVAGDLGDEHPLWLIDLPGCGASDKPAAKRLGPGGYGPFALGDRLYQAIGWALSEERHDREIVIVGHSTGALIVTRMLADPDLRTRHATVLARVAGALLITPLDVAVEKPVPTLEYIARLSGAEVCLGNALGIMRQRMAEGVAASYEDPELAPREEVDRGVRILTDAATRHAMQAMILQATPRRHGQARPDWSVVDSLVRQYSNIDIPIAIVCGAHDETLPASMSYKLAAQIPGATLEVIPNCKHSPQLEQPQNSARGIRRFIKRIDCTSGQRETLSNYG